MGLLPSRSVEIEISNKTRNITLKNPRTYFNCGRRTHSFLPELSPGSSGICHFSSSSWGFWGVAGVLVYEAESFTLAIHFYNCIDKFPRVLGLELSPGKAHLGRLVDTYARMAHGTYCSSDPDMKFDRIIVGKDHGTVQVSHAPVTVTATMANAINPFLDVVLEEEKGSGKEVKIENTPQGKIGKILSQVRHYQEQ